MPEMEIETAIWLAIWFFLFVKIWLPLIFPDNPPEKIYWNWGELEKQINDNSKIYKKIDKENLALENLKIQKEELENEIDVLELESSTDFEKEASNSTRIKKLKLRIKHIEISIDNKYNNLDNLNKSPDLVEDTSDEESDEDSDSEEEEEEEEQKQEPEPEPKKKKKVVKKTK